MGSQTPSIPLVDGIDDLQGRQSLLRNQVPDVKLDLGGAAWVLTGAVAQSVQRTALSTRTNELCADVVDIRRFSDRLRSGLKPVHT